MSASIVTVEFSRSVTADEIKAALKAAYDFDTSYTDELEGSDGTAWDVELPGSLVNILQDEEFISEVLTPTITMEAEWI